MTYNESILLQYITFARRFSPSDLTESDLSGWLDYYERTEMSQAQIGEALHGLQANGFLNADLSPTPLTLALKRKARNPIADFFGGRASTKVRFQQLLQDEYGPIR